MATGTTTPALIAAGNSTDTTERSLIVRGTIALSAAADLYAAGGLIVDFTVLGDVVKSSSPPSYVRVWSQKPAASPNATQYLYSFNPGTTQANGKMQIWEQSGADDTPLDEYDDATALTNPFADSIYFEATFPRL